MLRPRSTAHVLLVLTTFAFAAIAGACSGPPEQGVLNRYFRAARVGDNTTLANIATATLESGVVQSFEITNVGEEQRRPLRTKELADAFEAVEAEQQAYADEMKAYQDENLEAIDRVLRAERDDEEEVAKQDAEVQEAWTKWRAGMAEHAREVSEAGQALSAERGAAELSVFNISDPIDITQFEGEIVSKPVTIEATVTTEDGQESQKTLVVTLSQTTLVEPDGGQRQGRWVITGIRES